jgi:hypothetical protein
VRRWADFDPKSADGIKSVRELAKVFSGPLFTQRLNAEYLKRVQEWLPLLLADLDRLGGGSTFWQMPALGGEGVRLTRPPRTALSHMPARLQSGYRCRRRYS